MNEIFKEIFSEFNYQVLDKNSENIFYGNSNQEYFMTAEYTIEELNNFFETEKTDNLLNFFESVKSERIDIKKNTTLYIFLKTENIAQFYDENKNTIFRIEEDQYYFRKHIIVYTNDGISNIDTTKKISSQLTTILLEEGRIDDFVDNYYTDEEYFIGIQLMAKIPFLVIQDGSETYESLSEKIHEEKEIIEIVQFSDWLNNVKNVEIENYYSNLEEDIISELDDTKYLQEFFLKYEEIVE